jgi:hypothetical protein
MPDAITPRAGANSPLGWPDGATRVPYGVYRDNDSLKREWNWDFKGPFWNVLRLEKGIASARYRRTSGLAQMSVAVAREPDGSIAAFANYCEADHRISWSTILSIIPKSDSRGDSFASCR